MTQQEFMERTGITPTAEDFDYILSLIHISLLVKVTAKIWR